MDELAHAYGNVPGTTERLHAIQCIGRIAARTIEGLVSRTATTHDTMTGKSAPHATFRSRRDRQDRWN